MMAEPFLHPVIASKPIFEAALTSQWELNTLEYAASPHDSLETPVHVAYKSHPQI